MQQSSFLLYNPALETADTLLAAYTARHNLLETLLGIIRDNEAGRVAQHCLLIGGRGMGKTTTLWAVAHRVSSDSVLEKLWQPVVFDEESRRIGDLAGFWLECLLQLEVATGDRTDRFSQVLARPDADIEELARSSFLGRLNGKRALLLIDNFNEMLAAIRSTEGLHRLRAFLMNRPEIMVIGTAAHYFGDITSVDRPFFEFFRSFDLHPLSLEEVTDCLKSTGERGHSATTSSRREEARGRIKALHLLTGGSPRVMKMICHLAEDGFKGDIASDLEQLLDELTPTFRGLLDRLPMQQQQIFDGLALAWDPVEVSTLAVATRIASNQVSAILKKLVKSGFVCEALGTPTRKTYMSADRLLNLYYLMRHGRAHKKRTDGFVRLVQLLSLNAGLPVWAAQTSSASSEDKEYPAKRRKAIDEFLRLQGNGRFCKQLLPSWDDPERWRSVLRELGAVSKVSVRWSKIDDLLAIGFINFAILESPERALQLMDEVAERAPFGTIADACISATNADHLHKLSPERRKVVVEILKIISGRIGESGLVWARPQKFGKKLVPHHPYLE